MDPALDAAISAPAPDLELSARMLNEFVYCPRLFYYEYVDGIFVHNADTLRGAHIHRRVDSGSGKMPPDRPEAAAGANVSTGKWRGDHAPGTSRKRERGRRSRADRRARAGRNHPFALGLAVQ